jgi:hypothetical protein
LDCLRRITALLTSAAEIDAVRENLSWQNKVE